MPPKLLSDDGANMVIRPLAYSREKEIAEYTELKSFPIIPCNLCGSQENLKRASVKDMLNQWDIEHPGRIESIFTAMQNTSPSQGVDREQFYFMSLSRDANAPLKVKWQNLLSQPSTLSMCQTMAILISMRPVASKKLKMSIK